MPTANHQGALAPEHSFLQIQPDHVVVTAVKNAEDGNELVLRFYEWAGREADVRLHLSGKAESAAELDLMERPMQSLSIRDAAVILHTKPYEIKTVRVRLAP